MNIPNAKTVSFYHLTTTGGQSQSYSSVADVTARCGFFPLDRKNAVLAGPDLLDPHELYCPASADIRPQDKVTIGGNTSTWFVAHIFDAPFGGHGHRRVTISRQL